MGRRHFLAGRLGTTMSGNSHGCVGSLLVGGLGCVLKGAASLVFIFLIYDMLCKMFFLTTLYLFGRVALFISRRISNKISH